MSLFSNKKTEDKEVKKAAVEKKSSSATESTKKPATKKAVKSASMKDLYVGTDKVKEKADTSDKSSSKKNNSFLAERVLVKPLVTEKGSSLSVSGKYVFAISNKANKISVEKAILEAYGIKPVKVNILNVLGKRKRHGRIIGKRKDWKKAIVTLPKGKSIEVYEGI